MHFIKYNLLSIKKWKIQYNSGNTAIFAKKGMIKNTSINNISNSIYINC